jgi:hypothetical protein
MACDIGLCHALLQSQPINSEIPMSKLLHKIFFGIPSAHCFSATSAGDATPDVKPEAITKDLVVRHSHDYLQHSQKPPDAIARQQSPGN